MKNVVFILMLFPVCCFAQWTQVGNAINGQAANDRCGFSTAISADGSVVAMGSSGNSSGSSNAGQVRIFGYTNGVWTQIGSDLNGESSGDQTGQSVSLSSDGSIVAIGEPFNNDLGYTSGQVRVFKNIDNNWSQIGQDLYGQNAIAEAGKSVDLSADGSIVAFGAPNTTVNGVFFAGKVKVFELQNNSWVQKGGDIEGDGTIIKFGQSVSLSDSGNIIAIGQTGDPSNVNPSDTGRVMVYQYVGNQWVQLGNTILGSVERDEFGKSVSLSSSGNILAIGAYSNNVVKVFELTNGVWTQMGNTIVGESPGSTFGFSVSLSSSGSKIAIGDRFNSISGNQTGRAYVFENQGGNWTLVGDPIVGSAVGDQTGFSVAISQDGSSLAVGASSNDDNGANAGHVRVFENNTILGIDHAGDMDLAINYPNPAAEVIQIQSKQTINAYKIFSIDGRMVEQKNDLNLTEFSIDINNLTFGTYILILQTQSGKRSLKIIKE